MSRYRNHLMACLPVILVVSLGLIASSALQKGGEEALGTRKYNDYQTPGFCGLQCHNDIYQQWKQAMMSQAYTHHWDEIEYFKLAVPHAEKDPMVAGVKADCNGCHSPLAFWPVTCHPRCQPKNSRANESVSCELCHTVTGFAGDVPFNFNWISIPGKPNTEPAAEPSRQSTTPSNRNF